MWAAVIGLAAAAAVQSECHSPFREGAAEHADVYFLTEPRVLSFAGSCKQFHGHKSCCSSAYTVALDARVRGLKGMVIHGNASGALCVDRLLEFFTGAACVQCDPAWTRYSAEAENGEWLITVQQENCDYLWDACGAQFTTQQQFCKEAERLSDPEEFQSLLMRAVGLAPLIVDEPPARPVMVVVHHKRIRRVRVRRGNETNSTDVGTVVHDKAPGSAVEHTKDSEDVAAAAAAAAAADNSTDRMMNASAGFDGVADVIPDVAPLTATQPLPIVDSLPCKIPVPRVSFSTHSDALSAVDEGQFAGYRPISATIPITTAIIALFLS